MTHEGTQIVPFDINIPNKLYDVEAYKYLETRGHAEVYMAMYVEDITPEDKADVIKHKKYVRFICYQDTPKSRVYVRVYCRPINEMIPEHLTKAIRIIKTDRTRCLGEMNHTTSGYFFTFQF